MMRARYPILGRGSETCASPATRRGHTQLVVMVDSEDMIDVFDGRHIARRYYPLSQLVVDKMSLGIQGVRSAAAGKTFVMRLFLAIEINAKSITRLRGRLNIAGTRTIEAKM